MENVTIDNARISKIKKGCATIFLICSQFHSKIFFGQTYQPSVNSGCLRINSARVRSDSDSLFWAVGSSSILLSLPSDIIDSTSPGMSIYRFINSSYHPWQNP